MLTRWATSPHPTPHPEDVHGRETTKPDTGAILDTIATRFLAAKQEMAVAHGGLWKNDMWDLAARKLRVKREMLGKWSGTCIPLSFLLFYQEAWVAAVESDW